MKIVILGTGCAKCRQTEEAVRQAVELAGVDATIDKIEEPREIAKYRVWSTPAVAIDGSVKVSGRVPAVAEIRSLLAAG